jgi:hypothetical protein
MQSCNSIHQARLRAAKVAGSLLVVAVAHSVAQLLLYRSRVTGNLHAGDFAVFAIPAFVSWLAYLSVFVVIARMRSFVAPTLAFGASCLSFFVGMVVGLNLYGS